MRLPIIQVSSALRWVDGAPNSWEFEDHISPALIQAFESGEADASAELDLPQHLQDEKALSKRAARRAKKAARRAALEGNGNARNGNHASDHADGDYKASLQESDLKDDSQDTRLGDHLVDAAQKSKEREIVSV